MIRYITSADEKPANPVLAGFRAPKLYFVSALSPPRDARIVTVSGRAAVFVSHSCAQCPLSETTVFAIPSPGSLSENFAPLNPSPRTSNIGAGICTHQFGGS